MWFTPEAGTSAPLVRTSPVASSRLAQEIRDILWLLGQNCKQLRTVKVWAGLAQGPSLSALSMAAVVFDTRSHPLLAMTRLRTTS